MGFELFSLPVLGDRLYYLFQRYVTHSLPRPDLDHALDLSIEHCRLLDRFSTTPLNQAMHFEFGAGWDLCNNICFYCQGIDRQITIDINQLARRDLINTVIDHIQQRRPPAMTRLPNGPLPRDFMPFLRQAYGIDYRPLCDASATGLDQASLDFITTTNTLEHIPRQSIQEILLECRRILKPGGLMSMKIDYSDHYSHADASITPYNFLQFTEEQWRKYNPSIHFQNRLRHRDHCELFQEAGFEVLHDQGEMPDHGLEQVALLHPAPPFDSYEPEQLAVTSGWFVLRRA